ncbi:MAG: hypothetical protein LBC90_04910 [Candidatus Adiutrix sp.]|jgi:hypothetical protein|nr:hypothetical protein [Candidatus Adiutrix sp.]
MRKRLLLAVLATILCLSPGLALGQTGGGAALPDAAYSGLDAEKDTLHLNTIGAFSAGFVLQAYGYIGVLADVLYKEVYAPDLVRTMLGETVTYMRNVNAQLLKYRSGPPIAQGDLEFIAAIMEIINHLIAEAEALSSFTQTKSDSDLRRYDEARNNAWKSIQKTFKVK